MRFTGGASVLAGDILPMLDGALENEDGIPQPPEAIKGKIVGLYFSAGWCPPCRRFSPELAQFQEQNSDEFVVCFVSSDRSEADMLSFVKGKSFLRVPFGSPTRRQIQAKLGVSMLPTLLIIGTDGHILTDWGRMAVTRNPSGCIEAWKAGSHGCGWLTLAVGSCSVQ